MGNRDKIIHGLFAAGFIVCLLQVWLPGHYLTGDGPCHLYNAQVVRDLWVGEHVSLYNRFYALIYNPDPNCFTTFALAALLFVAKGAMAEKLFLTLYLAVDIGGCYQLMRKVAGGATWWMLAMFILVFPLTLAKGFYNFSFSIGVYFWAVWAWIRFMERRSIGAAAAFFLFSIVLFFTHLLPFVFGAFTCGALSLSFAIAAHSQVKDRVSAFMKNVVLLVLLLVPGLLLMVLFMHNEAALGLQLKPHQYRLLELAQFKYNITLANTEKLPNILMGCSVMLLCVGAIVYAVKDMRVHRYDGITAALLFAGLVYFLFPEDFMGRAIDMTIRMQPIVMVLAVCALAFRLREGSVKTVGALLLFVFFGWISVVRMMVMADASRALDEYLAVDHLIKPGTVVLPLAFSKEGEHIDGRLITDRNSVFHHAADYLGVGKALILLDNYEANMGYFPIKWKDDVNPYTHLSRGKGIEGVPPGGDIAAYKQKTGVDIEHIIMWCYKPEYLKHEQFRNFYNEITAGYHLVYTSPTGRVLLYDRN